MFTPWGTFAGNVILKLWKNELNGNIFWEMSYRGHVLLPPTYKIIPKPLLDKLFIIYLVYHGQQERIQ